MAGWPTQPARGRLWGARFATGPDQAAWDLGRSIHVDVRLWRYDLTGSRAHADELRRLDLLSAEDHQSLMTALVRIEGEFTDGSFTFLDGDEDIHGAVERRLIELAPDAGGRLRAGRSRNDQIANDLRLYLADRIAELVDAVRGVQAALADQAEQAVDVLAPGYTHLQRAQPVTLAHHLLAHGWALDRDVGRLLDCRRAGFLRPRPWPPGAMAGLTLPLDPESYAGALGYRGVAQNSMDAVADRDFAVEFLAGAAMLGVHLSRLCEEVVVWATVEFGWVRVGDAFSTGSSIMPQKRNPDVAELVRGKTGRLIGGPGVAAGHPQGPAADLQPRPAGGQGTGLRRSRHPVAGTAGRGRDDPDPDLRHRADRRWRGGWVRPWRPTSPRRWSWPVWRSATLTNASVSLVAVCEASGIDITDLSTEALSDRLPELDPSSIDDLLDPVGAVRRRSAVQGPAPAAVRQQLANLRTRIDHDPRS